MQTTKEITTPIGGDKVVIKTMMTGAEREQIEGAQMKFVHTADLQEFRVTDMKAAALAQKHELLKISVVSINEDPANCFERLQKMYDTDYDFVFQTILEEQKKMKPSTSPQS